MSDPELIEVRGIDITPYDYAIWCTVGGSEPFANTIEARSWSDDGEHIWLMLGTHNFYKCKPDELVKVVAATRPFLARKHSSSLFGCDCAECFPKRKPVPAPCSHCGGTGQAFAAPKGGARE